MKDWEHSVLNEKGAKRFIFHGAFPAEKDFQWSKEQSGRSQFAGIGGGSTGIRGVSRGAACITDAYHARNFSAIVRGISQNGEGGQERPCETLGARKP